MNTFEQLAAQITDSKTDHRLEARYKDVNHAVNIGVIDGTQGSSLHKLIAERRREILDQYAQLIELSETEDDLRELGRTFNTKHAENELTAAQLSDLHIWIEERSDKIGAVLLEQIRARRNATDYSF